MHLGEDDEGAGIRQGDDLLQAGHLPGGNGADQGLVLGIAVASTGGDAGHAPVKLLKELELVKDDGTGRLVPSDKSVTTGEQWASVAVASFQKETIALAGEALERHPRDQRDISTITMSVNREDIAEIKERIAEFRSSIIKFVNESANPEVVCHLNLQLIPLSVFPKEEK